MITKFRTAEENPLIYRLLAKPIAAGESLVSAMTPELNRVRFGFRCRVPRKGVADVGRTFTTGPNVKH